MGAHAVIPTLNEAEAGRLLQIQGQPALHNERDYVTEKMCRCGGTLEIPFKEKKSSFYNIWIH